MVRNRSNLSAQEKRARLMRASENNRAVAIAQTKDTHFSRYLRDAIILFGITLFLLSAMMIARADAKDTQDRTLADLADSLQNAVVNISTSQKVKPAFNKRGAPGRPPQLPKGLPFEKFFKDFFDENNKNNRAQRVSSLGSGFVIDTSGLIVTNNHVIKGADEIFVNFVDGTKLKVDKVLGVDAKTDLALLKVSPKKPLSAVPFGKSSEARVGDWVMAIGNPFGLGGTVTVGIVSAKDRDINSGPYDEFIQTDAAINKGNSGGPLFNMKGEVIGVNTAIISPSGGSIGIGFSVPSDTVVNVVSQLKKYGETRRGWLGVLIQKVTPEIAEGFGMAKPEGALVSRVTKGGPAEKAGFVPSDIILEFDGNYVKSSRELPKIVALTPVEKTVDVKLLRQGKEVTVKVKIARLEAAEKNNPELAGRGVQPDKPVESAVLGMTLSNITPDLRRQYRLDAKTKGVVITKVAPNSRAAEKGLRPGFVIVEVMQEQVSTADQVVKKVEALKKTNKKNIIFFIARGRGEFGFVALPSNPAG
ncbi:MAG: Do family serine endopeptidase [Hyphomicrobiales bacterium]